MLFRTNKSVSSFTSLIRCLLKWHLYWELRHDWQEMTADHNILKFLTETMLSSHILSQPTYKRNDIILVPMCNMLANCPPSHHIYDLKICTIKLPKLYRQPSQQLNELILDNTWKYDGYFVRNMFNSPFRDTALRHGNMVCLLQNKVLQYWTINRCNTFIVRNIVDFTTIGET